MDKGDDKDGLPDEKLQTVLFICKHPHNKDKDKDKFKDNDESPDGNRDCLIHCRTPK